MARKVGSDGARTAKAIRRNSVRLFAARGYEAVSMRMIADSVDVQPAALYQYYRSKQDLLLGIMREHMERLLQAWSVEPSPTGGVAAALEHFARFHIRYHIERPDEVFISYMELRSLDEPGLREIGALRGRYEDILKDILRRGREKGVFMIADPHVAAMAVLAMITGVNTWYRSGGRLSLKKVEDIYVNMVLGSVGCPISEDAHV